MPRSNELTSRCHRAQLDDARPARVASSLIEGGPGSASRALLWEARRLAGERGFRNLGARCDELEDSIAFGLASQLLTAPLQRARPDASEPSSWRAPPREPRRCCWAVARTAARSPRRSAIPGQAMLGGLTWLVDNLAAQRRS